MKLIARKVCNFGGKKFYIGDEIPVELVLNPMEREKRGVLKIVYDEAEAAALAPEKVTVDTMTIVVHAEEGDLPLNITRDGLQAVVDVLTTKVDDAEPIIEQMTDDDALILLHLADSRKAIKEAAEARAKALNAENTEDAEDTEEGEQ